MTANKDLGRRLSELYSAEAATRAPDWLLESALETIDTTPQRRVLVRLPWKLPMVDALTKVAVAAAVIVAVGVIGLAFFRPTSSQVGGPQVSPSPSPSVSLGPSPSTHAALTETFTSDIHGLSVSHPDGWMVQRATEPWTSGIVEQMSEFGDVICSWGDQAIPARAVCDESPVNIFLALASQPLGGVSGDEWIADYLVRDATCRGSTEQVTIDGVPGVVATDCYEGRAAFVTVGDRGYMIWLYGSGDVGWFRDIVATVKLHPEDATDTAPSVSP
jgi:hypothetical protein